MKFTEADALILFALAGPPTGCAIPEIYWRADFWNHVVVSADEIQAAIEKGLKSGLLGYRDEKFFMTPAARNTITGLMFADKTIRGRTNAAKWLSENFREEIRSLRFELIENKNKDFRYGLESVEWRVLQDEMEVTTVEFTQ